MQQNWAKNLTNQLILRMTVVQHHAAHRVHKAGGHRVAQCYAAESAKVKLLEDGSAANAIAFGIIEGMKINRLVTSINQLKSEAKKTH